MRRIATWCAVLAAVASIGLCAQLRCESDRRLRALEQRAETLTARVTDVDGDGALRKAFPGPAIQWWCAWTGCFREQADCAAALADIVGYIRRTTSWTGDPRQVTARCEPARIAYCSSGLRCYPTLEQCQKIEAARKSTCLGFE